MSYSYLQNRRAGAPEHTDKDSDNESIGDDEFDDILEKMMKKRGFKKDMDDDHDEDYSDLDADDLDFADEYTKNMLSKKSKKKSVDGKLENILTVI